MVVVAAATVGGNDLVMAEKDLVMAVGYFG